MWLIGMRYKIMDATTTEQVAQGYTEEKTRAAIKALMRLAPQVALLEVGHAVLELPVLHLQVREAIERHAQPAPPQVRPQRARLRVQPAAQRRGPPALGLGLGRHGAAHCLRAAGRRRS